MVSVVAKKLHKQRQEKGSFVRYFLAPTGAQGVKMSVCVSVCVTFFKITLKMSSRSILKSPGGF